MSPAVQLASNLHEMTASFFAKVFRAPLIATEKGNMLDPTFQPDNDDIDAYWDEMENFPALLEVFTGFNAGFDACGSWGLSAPTRDPRHALCVQLNSRFALFFKHPFYDQLETALKQRVLLSLAVTLVHEHAHLVFKRRVWDEYWLKYDAAPHDQRGNLIPDPIYDAADPKAELGFAWERYAFGGLVHQDHSHQDHSFHLINKISVLDWDMLVNEARLVEIPCEAGLVAAYFDKDCWDQVDAVAGRHNLTHVFPTPAARHIHSIMSGVYYREHSWDEDESEAATAHAGSSDGTLTDGEEETGKPLDAHQPVVAAEQADESEAWAPRMYENAWLALGSHLRDDPAAVAARGGRRARKWARKGW